MRAVRLVKVGQPLVMQEVPLPEVGASDVRVRVRAAGICHSDVHYRNGVGTTGPLPLTLGHEVAGVVDVVGAEVSRFQPGDRVALHYLVTCGECEYCRKGLEQFCAQYKMIGKDVDGGYAEYVSIPARSLVPVPAEVAFEQAAVMMCSSATALHAIRKARLGAGETVAVFGLGGLGMSAVQIARAFGALMVFAVDLDPEKLRMAASYGAEPVDARKVDPVTEIRRVNGGRGVDVALEMIGLAQTMRQAVQAVGNFGRIVLVGITSQPLQIDTYRELLGKEAELIGSNDHLMQELPLLMEMVRWGRLDLSRVVARTVQLDADIINHTLDSLERYSSVVRTVIVP